MAYGKMLGTTAFCAVVPILFSSIPYRYLRRVFPPVVTSTTIIMIGINLTGSGFTNWGGGDDWMSGLSMTCDCRQLLPVLK